ncbi:POK6 protein, partial [Himantopus himantopus]|nr:POK6 protein [Himantopus himantopus]
LRPLQLWQMDVTHVPSFGRLKYVHVTVDTFSHAVWATPLSGETARHVMLHLRGCFAALGVPLEIKTDNGPAYTSQALQRFMNLWGVKHVTGIPHSPTGQ